MSNCCYCGSKTGKPDVGAKPVCDKCKEIISDLIRVVKNEVRDKSRKG